MTTDERVQFKLMLPASLKASLEDEAHRNRRSLSAEIIARLSESLVPEEEVAKAKAMAQADMELIVERVVRRIRDAEDQGRSSGK